SSPEVSSRFRLFPRVGQGVGQDKKPTESSQATGKSKLKLYPQYPFYNMQTSKISRGVPALTTHPRRRKWPRNNLAIYNKSLAFIMRGFVNGWAGEIRTHG
ncbi:MAG: hypothetical protein K2P33_12165, partial [Acutalibacter sp.]|nr:hypothetical protein [Acutalibacter sp.]